MLKFINILIAFFVRGFYKIVILFDHNLKKEFEIIKSTLLQNKINNPRLEKIVIFVEDKRFFNHKGIDVRAIVRALYKTIIRKRTEGGSTIEQQYVRLITGRREITLSRKAREWLLATKLSNDYTKSKILNSYLLRYRFIDYTCGIKELAQKNGFNIYDLNNEQISVLVTRLKYPFLERSLPRFSIRMVMISKLIKKETAKEIKSIDSAEPLFGYPR